ncbi:polygalacturonate 4-alpha-galacturonosyltransferase [Ranunculus cassubicifolius]
MKGGGVSSYSFPAKRGWRGGAIAVLGLVILSMLVPLGFLLGLHNNFLSSVPDTNEDRNSSPVGDSKEFGNHNRLEQNESSDKVKDDKAAHVDDLLKRFAPPIIKGGTELSGKGTSNEAVEKNAPHLTKDVKQEPFELHKDMQKTSSDTKNEVTVAGGVIEHREDVGRDETKKSCELEFGSYCLWCQEHKEEMKDSMVKKLKDQLYVARAYFPIVAKLPTQQKFSRDMKQNIQEFEKMLSEATTDADLPPHVDQKLRRMGEILTKSRTFQMDCNYVDKKLRQILDLSEDEAHFHMKQSAFLYELAVQTMPKSHHCLSMRLTVEYFRSHSLDMDLLPTEKHFNPNLHHYIILSKNILSSSVVINSTVMHSKESQNQVFHVVTDGENYYAMKLWFYMNSYKEATVHVLNIEDIDLGYHEKVIPQELSLPEEYRIILHKNTQYISLFGHTHFLLPDIFSKLKKVVILDDDVVVQRDLSPLWSLQMGGKVNGAVHFCDIKMSQLKGYFGETSYSNKDSCTWMSGLNIVDLVKWRELNLTETYRKLLQSKNGMGSFPANLLTFHDQVYGLDSSWAVSGLGHNYGVNAVAIDKAAVLHYNGKMKPWLELGIRNYKARWKKYLKRADQYMGECNVNT